MPSPCTRTGTKSSSTTTTLRRRCYFNSAAAAVLLLLSSVLLLLSVVAAVTAAATTTTTTTTTTAAAEQHQEARRRRRQLGSRWGEDVVAVPPVNNNGDDSDDNDKNTADRIPFKFARTTSSLLGTRDGKGGTDDTDDVEELFFEQRLDHFRPFSSSSDDEVFRQRYFYSDRYVSKKGNSAGNNTTTKTVLALLCVGGEGPALDKSALVDSVHCSGDMLEFAKSFGRRSRRKSTSSSSTDSDDSRSADVHLFALEHRYYGQSYPEQFVGTFESPVSNSNLVYLNSKQAVADVAHFVSEQTAHLMLRLGGSASDRNNNNDPENRPAATKIRWLTFGGSYPGMVSAWSRSKFSHLVYAAVSNSAPVMPLLDFAQYNAHVAQAFNGGSSGGDSGSTLPLHGADSSFSAAGVAGGSPTCLRIIEQGHAELVREIGAALRQNNRTSQRWIASQFNLCDDGAALFGDGEEDDRGNLVGYRYRQQTALQRRNTELFVGDGVGQLMGLPQSNDPACNYTLCNIQKVCQGLEQQVSNATTNATNTTTTRNMQALAWYVQQLNRRDNNNSSAPTQCLDLDWEATIRWIANPHNKQNWGARSWLWQTCTEFGFYQTCETAGGDNGTNGSSGDDGGGGGGGCPFGRGYHPLSQDLEICERAFGIQPNEVARNIQATIEYYGGWKLDTPRILSMTGSVDPWSELALPKDTSNPQRPVYQVPGASHHFWTHPPLETDNDTIQQAREIIVDTLRHWIDQDNNDDDSGADSDAVTTPPDNSTRLRFRPPSGTVAHG